ncbi:MBOAT family O-acyltransferase [Chitinimonas koreensis]|uniref:MBOAT family O-acyltransferase n=1 Tax=Chitinimonas koreensis TaxID=356302 RepID=UPI000427D9B1|nr:MBOAT family O-acyltransferase [Chitinimonas koreensis]QNM97366.1 D-alanyl transfer protein [Chitinimonas koreensis]
MLPFSSLSFFAAALALVALLHLARPWLARRLPFDRLLAGIALAYALAAIPKGWLLVGYAAGLYGLYRLRLAGRIGTPVALFAALLPLLCYKLSAIAPESHAPQLGAFGVLGLSYLSFRAIQLLLDGPYQAPLGAAPTLAFLLFPPSLSAGPIDRSYRFAQDLAQGYAGMTREAAATGLHWLAQGYVLKFGAAQLVAACWLDRFAAPAGWLDTAGDAYGYSVFLYCDFAGYSLMALGLARCIGVSLPANFDRPWLALDPQSFWRRFHISLGSFLNDYFFKPIYMKLAGTERLRRHRLLNQSLALFATFLLMGAWNGLAWHYLASGALFGLASVLHNLYAQRWRRGVLARLEPRPLALRLYRLGAWFLMFHLAIVALYLFSGRFHP